MLEAFVQEINRFTMAGGREESRTLKQRPGVFMFLSRGIWTRRAGGRVEGRTLKFRNFLEISGSVTTKQPKIGLRSNGFAHCRRITL